MQRLLELLVRHGRLGRARGRLTTLATMQFRDWRILAEAWMTIVAVGLALRIADFPRLMTWASRMPGGATQEWSRNRVERIAWLVKVASRLTPFRCLPRSLTLTRVLARRGVASTMRIGVQTKEGTLLAHAWVEWDGRALNDDARSLQHFAPFDGLMGGISNA